LGLEERTLKLEAFSAQIQQFQLGATQMTRLVHDQLDCCLKETYFLKQKKMQRILKKVCGAEESRKNEEVC
jgi:hypothetical protein